MKRRDDVLHARFLTFSTYRRLALFGSAAIRTRFIEHLAAARGRYQFQLFAWVVMPEHVHLLLRPCEPEFPVRTLLTGLKRGFGREVIDRWKALGATILGRLEEEGAIRFWQRGGGYDRNVFSTDELNEKFAYIHHNPVKRSLVRFAEDWEWSSARWYAGDKSGLAPDRLPG